MLSHWQQLQRAFDWPWVPGTFSFADPFLRRSSRLLAHCDRTLSLGRRASVSESDEEYLVIMDLPGLSSEDVQATFHEDVLTLKGKRAVEIPQGYKTHRQEREAIEFEQSFKLPAEIDVSKVDATVKNGVLTVTLPKLPASRPRQIEVKTV